MVKCSAGYGAVGLGPLRLKLGYNGSQYVRKVPIEVADIAGIQFERRAIYLQDASSSVRGLISFEFV
jgi:hypothetical protein